LQDKSAKVAPLAPAIVDRSTEMNASVHPADTRFLRRFLERRKTAFDPDIGDLIIIGKREVFSEQARKDSAY
jgi:hypothetical protein